MLEDAPQAHWRRGLTTPERYPKRDAQDLVAVYRGVLARVDCARLITDHFRRAPLSGSWDIIALGKAAAAAAEASTRHLQERLRRGFVLTKTGHLRGTFDSRFELQEAAHPIPDEQNLLATSALLEWCARPSEAENLLVLMSGGASSLLCCPVEGLTLAEFQRVQSTLLRSGLPIEKINVLRKHLSQVKGGQMASRTVHYQEKLQLTFVDVCAPRLSSEEVLALVGSGPFLADPSNRSEAEAILETLSDALGPRLTSKTQSLLCETPKSSPFRALSLADHRSLGDCARSLLGGRVLPRPTFELQGEVPALARRLAKTAVALRDKGEFGVLVLTGEPTVKIDSKAGGKGGRCQELALRFAREVAGLSGLRLLAGSSDGSDGPTEVAAAVVDGTTWPKICEAVGEEKAEALLRDHDSYTALSLTSNSLLETGPTGQNLNDLVLLEISCRTARFR